jgi:hypothetical protein
VEPESRGRIDEHVRLGVSSDTLIESSHVNGIDITYLVARMPSRADMSRPKVCSLGAWTSCIGLKDGTGADLCSICC